MTCWLTAVTSLFKVNTPDIFRPPRMRLTTAFQLHRALLCHDTALLYSGSFHDDHTAGLIALGESITSGQGVRPAARGRLAFIMVEAYQNILRHRAPMPYALDRNQGRSMFMLTCGSYGQRVLTSNPVHKDRSTVLRDLLERLKGMDSGSLKEHFLSMLQREHDGKRRGAGLGLIEMARRSGSELGYELKGLGTDFDLFILAVSMGERGQQTLFTEAGLVHGTVVQQDILLLYTGDQPPSVQEALLQVVEEDLDDRRSPGTIRGKAFLAANAALGAESSRAFIALVREGEHVGLLVGAEMPSERADALVASTAHLRSLDRSEIDRRYRQALLRPGIGTEGPDLLELARLSVEPLEAAAIPQTDRPGSFVVLHAVM